MDRVVLQNLAQLVNSPTSESQREALVYFEQLRNSEGAWKQGLQLLLTDPTLDETIKYLCLQIIEFFIRNRYASSSAESQTTLKQFLQQWIQLQCANNLNQKDYIRNKIAQIFCLVFIQDYPVRWPNFFSDLMQTLPLGHQAVDNYLRVLETIDTDVTSREAVDSPQEAIRNTMMKDTMRETCVAKLVESWFHILDVYQNSQPALAGRCLQVIGAYISWIDINLVVNDQFIPLLVQQLSHNELREDAADCLLSIINKGMEPSQKMKLVNSLSNILDASNVLNPLNPSYREDETEFTAKISKLVNGMGMMLIDCYNKFLKAGDEAEAISAMASVERILSSAMGFLANDYDDVSAAVIEFCKLYIYTIKNRAIRTESQEEVVGNLLGILIKKLQYDESYNFESEGEDEADFHEFRKQIKVILDNLVGLNKDLVLTYTEKYVVNILPRWRYLSFADIEVGVALIYYIGEALPNSGGNHFTGGEPNALRNMMRVLVMNDLSSHSHSAVKLMYFETVARYEKFFLVEPQHLENVLAAFVDQRGLRNENVKVQSRCAYLFSKFLKSVKSHIQDFAPNLLHALKDLLELNAPPRLGTPIHKFALSDGDQLYIYEACSTLVMASRLDNASKAALFTELVNPLVQRIRPLLDEMLSEADPVRKEALAESVCHAMALTSRSSKAFSSQQSMKIIGCHKLYLQALETFFLLCLQVPEHQQKLQMALRQYLHRMVVCLDVDILPIMPTICNMLMNASNAHSFQEYLPILIQLMTKFKKEVVPFLSASFIPIIDTMVRVLEQQVDETDEEAVRDRQGLQRNYFLFISTVVSSNDIIAVLDCIPLQGLERLLGSVVQGAVELTDPVAQKTCFSILKKLVETWGRREDKPGFHQYVLENIVPACFMAPMKSTFDLRDAQTVMVMAEIASCLKAVVTARCQNLDKFLCDRIFPLHNIHDGMANEFVQALYHADAKTFKSYFKQFFMQMRP